MLTANLRARAEQLATSPYQSDDNKQRLQSMIDRGQSIPTQTKQMNSNLTAAQQATTDKYVAQARANEGLFTHLKICGYSDAEAKQACDEATAYENEHGVQHMQPYNAGKAELGMEPMR